MDPRLIPLLAARFGISPEQVDALRSGDPAAVLASGADPSVGLLLSVLAQHEVEPEPHRPDERLQAERALARARQMIQQLRGDLEATTTILTHIAGIVGACPACLGLSEACARCGGIGKPGSEPPGREALLAWIQPALARLGLRAGRPAKPEPARS